MKIFRFAKLPFLMCLVIVCLNADTTQEYSGYLVVDEEMVGFFPCGGGAPFGLASDHELLANAYRKYKQFLREPLYFVFEAKITGEGTYGIGMVDEKISRYLDANKIKRIERHERVTCGAIIPIDVEIEVLFPES